MVMHCQMKNILHFTQQSKSIRRKERKISQFEIYASKIKKNTISSLYFPVRLVVLGRLDYPSPKSILSFKSIFDCYSTSTKYLLFLFTLLEQNTFPVIVAVDPKCFQIWVVWLSALLLHPMKSDQQLQSVIKILWQNWNSSNLKCMCVAIRNLDWLLVKLFVVIIVVYIDWYKKIHQFTERNHSICY